MTYSDLELKRLQRLQLLNLLEVRRICQKFQIPYFLVGGTLLGAVRHHGFIPWDDDIDVGMMRNDYERFIKVCESELSCEFYLQTRDTDKNFALPWVKLQLRGTTRKDAGNSMAGVQAGIDLDIFPFDNITSNPALQWIHSNICWMLRGIYCEKCGYVLLNREKTLKKKYGIVFCRLISKLFRKDTLSKLLDKHFQIYNSKETEIIICHCGAYGYKKERQLLEDFFPLTSLLFEGDLFSVPKSYSTYLTKIYGDYMSLPPEKDRLPHEIVELDFGEYGDDVHLESLLRRYAHE